jgi:hypothetical protein
VNHPRMLFAIPVPNGTGSTHGTSTDSFQAERCGPQEPGSLLPWTYAEHGLRGLPPQLVNGHRNPLLGLRPQPATLRASVTTGNTNCAFPHCD